MQVIAGKARRIPLVTPEGRDTRPTTTRIKETLFNIIQSEIPGASFLDLFSGSGSIGIEACSRGAEPVVLVEFARKSLQCIDINLTKTKLKDEIRVLPMEVSLGIAKLSREGQRFDIIFADPPYRDGYEERILQWIQEERIVKKDTLIILECAMDTEVDFYDENLFHLEKVKEYKNNKHVFLRVTAEL